jgi:hypothetical protein
MRHSRCSSASAIAVLTLLAVSCGGSSKPKSVTVVPMSATLNPGGTQQFTANVQGTSDASVTWTVNGVVGGNTSDGTVSPAGLYTAPKSIASTFTANVQAASTKDSSVSATATVKVVPRKTASINRAIQPLPVQLGTSGGNAHDESSSFCCSGTLGALVNRGGSDYILSANHAIAISGAAKSGDPIIQPGLVDVSCTASKAHTVANFSQAPALKTSNVDAAIALIVPGTVDASGGILGLGADGGSGAPASDTAAPNVGMAVAKSGRSTGLTCSSISSVNTSVKVDYQEGCDTGTKFTATFTNQIVVNGGSFSSSGDSGSLIVDSQTAQAVGLLYAGSDTDTVANPIGDVLNALRDPGGVAPVIVGGAQHAVACTSASQVAAPQVASSEAEVGISAESIQRALAVKQRHEPALFKHPAVLGLGIGRSDDDPSQPAVIVFTDKHQMAPDVPRIIDGVRTRVVPSEHFRAQGWNEKEPTACAKPR